MPSGTPWRRYLLAHAGKSLLWHSSGLLFAFFLTETCGLTPRSMGLVLALSLFVNAAADLMIGADLHRHPPTWNALVRGQSIAAGIAALFFVLFCSTPCLPEPIRLAAALATLTGFRLAFAWMDVRQNALVTMLARRPDQRIRLLATRNVLAGGASLMVGMMGTALLLKGPSGALPHLLWATLVAAAVVLGARGLARLPWSDVASSEPAEPQAAGARAPLPGAIILLVTAAAAAGSTLFRATEPYAAAYAGMGISILAWSAVGAVLSQPVWTFAARRLPAPALPLLAAGCELISAFALGMHGIRVALIGLGFGVGSGGVWLMVWAAALRTTTGAGFGRTAGLTAVSKLAQGVAMLWLGEVLRVTPYRTIGTASQAATSWTMIAALALVVLGCLALSYAERRLSRTRRGGARAMRHPTGRRVPDPAPRPPIGSSAPAPRAAQAG